MKRNLRTKLDLLRPNIAEKVYARQSQQKATHDHQEKEREIRVDDPVCVRDFREKKAGVPGVIQEKTGPVSAKIALEEGGIVCRHQDHVHPRDVAETAPPTPPTEPSSDSPASPFVEETPMRPARIRRPPSYLKDYEQ